jgi:hypothetical protein
MKEKLLQYIWQFQYFNKNGLATTGGENIRIIHQGNFNVNQGADFTEARIKIGDTTWAGNVELHTRSSEWDLHHHSSDKNYGNIILHVVWQHDKEIKDINGNTLPTLELQDRISNLLLNRYELMMNTSSFIPCEKQAHHIEHLALHHWKQRLLAERLEQKSAIVSKHLKNSNHHWEETFWWMLAGNFGIKINSGAFEKIAMSIPVSLLSKHKNQLHQLEALLFGQAGLLEQVSMFDGYPLQLQKEYTFYKKKYGLQKPQAQLYFLRMRPANFPTIRLAQLAMLIHKSSHLLSVILEASTVEEVRKLLKVTAGEYWDDHYVFDESSTYKKKALGEDMINNILINTVVPVLFAYGLYHGEQQQKDKAIEWLENIASEKNNITRGFDRLKFFSNNSFDSQSFIQLKNNYCNKKRCLECEIGNAILRG